MPRYIDADALKELMIETLERIQKNPKMTGQEMHIIAATSMLFEMIDDATTSDAEPVRHGRWIWDEVSFNYTCSSCKCSYDYSETYGLFDHGFAYASYCPNCGAKMDDENAHEV